MNIKEALARIEALEADIQECEALVYMAHRDDDLGEFKGHEIAIRAGKYDGRHVRVKLTDFCSLLNSRKDEAQAEIDKIEPIIVMANAALRGI